VYKPNSEEVYTYTDLYVGATVEVHNRTFELIEADEYTYTYMENNKHIFIMADLDILLKSLKAQVVQWGRGGS
jgi:EF-hand domain-containing protein 1